MGTCGHAGGGFTVGRPILPLPGEDIENWEHRCCKIQDDCEGDGEGEGNVARALTLDDSPIATSMTAMNVVANCDGTVTPITF
jgi:hypothetical protein